MNWVSKMIAACAIPLGCWGVYWSIQNWSTDDAGYHFILSLLAIVVAAGYFIPERLLASFERDKEYDKPEPESSTIATQPEFRGDKKVFITIHKTYNDDGLDGIELDLKEDKRVLGTNSIGGRHYSVPDGDDLPEWYSLHIWCHQRDQDALLKDIEAKLESDFDEEERKWISVFKE